MAATMTPPAVALPRRRFTVEEFHHLAEAGILVEDERVELIEGDIVKMAAIGIRHMATVNAFGEVLYGLVQREGIVSVQNPIQLSNDSEPQPDVAVLRRRHYTVLPVAEDVLFLIEIADSTLDYDRQIKLPLYAAAGISEVWLADLRAEKLERHTEPRDGIFTHIQIAGRGEALSSTILPAVILSIDVIPREDEKS